MKCRRGGGTLDMFKDAVRSCRKKIKRGERLGFNLATAMKDNK